MTIFRTCRVKGTRFRRNQHNYSHGTEARRKVEKIDARLKLMRDWDDIDRYPRESLGAHNQSMITISDVIKQIEA